MRLNCFLLFYSIKKNMFQRTRLGHFTPILSPEKLCFTAGMFLASLQAGCFHSEWLMSCSDSTSWSKLCYRRQTSVRQLIKQSTSRWALSQAMPFNLTISSSTLSQVILPRYRHMHTYLACRYNMSIIIACKFSTSLFCPAQFCVSSII